MKKIFSLFMLTYLISNNCYAENYVALSGNAMGGDGTNVYIASQQGLHTTHDDGNHWILQKWNIIYTDKIQQYRLAPIPIIAVRLVSLDQFILLEYYRDSGHHLAFSSDQGSTFHDMAELPSDEYQGGFTITPNKEIIIGGYWCPTISHTSDTNQICVSFDAGQHWQTRIYETKTNSILKVGNTIYMGQYLDNPNLEYASFDPPPKHSWEWKRLWYKSINSNTLATAGDGNTIYIASQNSNGLLVSEDNGIHWYHNIKLPIFLYGISHVYANMNELFVSIANKNVFAFSHDKGINWQQISVAGPGNYQIINNIYATKKNIYVEMTQPNMPDSSHIYLKSKDQGQHWDLIES